jgi:hypothetical protein
MDITINITIEVFIKIFTIKVFIKFINKIKFI